MATWIAVWIAISLTLLVLLVGKHVQNFAQWATFDAKTRRRAAQDRAMQHTKR